MAQTAAATPVPTADQLLAMPYAQRQATLAAMPASQSAQLEAEIATAQKANNRAFMMRAYSKRAVCPPASGSGINQNYSAGQTLIYNFPTAGGAFITDLLFRLNLTVTPAVGTGAAYALNAAGALALLDRVRVQFNGTQINIRPYILKDLQKLRGYLRSRTGLILAGQQTTAFQNVIETGVPNVGAVVPTGANTWVVDFRLPLNAIHELDPRGLLPAMGAGTTGQIEVVCAPAALGVDPVLNAISTTAGTGAAVTVSGTIEIDAIYRDGSNMQSQNPLKLDLRGLPTIQMIEDEPLSPLSASVVNRHKIAALLQHAIVLHYLIDGNQSTKYSAYTNLQAFELDQDSVGQNKFFGYGTGNQNVDISTYFEQVRYVYGQDFDEGCFPHVNAVANGVVDPSNREGIQVLNMTPSGWTDVHHGWQVGTVGGVTGINPRVLTFLVSINPAGLGIA